MTRLHQFMKGGKEKNQPSAYRYLSSLNDLDLSFNCDCAFDLGVMVPCDQVCGVLQ